VFDKDTVEFDKNFSRLKRIIFLSKVGVNKKDTLSVCVSMCDCVTQREKVPRREIVCVRVSVSVCVRESMCVKGRLYLCERERKRGRERAVVT